MSGSAVIVGRLSWPRKLALAREIMRQYLHVRRLLWRRDLPSALATLRAGRGPVPPGDLADLDDLRLARATILVMRLLPGDTRCLMRSLVLLALMARRRRPATLVIGVEAGEGFRAHSWLEAGGRPLLPTEGFAPLTAL